MSVPPRFPLDASDLRSVVRAALDEDHAAEDATTRAVVPPERAFSGMIVARGTGVLCGLPLAVEAFAQLDARVKLTAQAVDGASLRRATPVLEIAGPAHAVLAAERTALNFAQRLSGIATLTRRFVDAVAGTRTEIVDTRKTTPGWRALEKYAVRCGGGANHRMHLADALLIKDNHLAAVGGDVAEAVRRARAAVGSTLPVQVECDNLDQVETAVAAGADSVLLDNMSIAVLADAVAIVNRRCITEASGGVTLDVVRAIAETGVDRISVGALTHSAPAFDLALDAD